MFKIGYFVMFIILLILDGYYCVADFKLARLIKESEETLDNIDRIQQKTFKNWSESEEFLAKAKKNHKEAEQFCEEMKKELDKAKMEVENNERCEE